MTKIEAGLPNIVGEIIAPKDWEQLWDKNVTATGAFQISEIVDAPCIESGHTQDNSIHKLRFDASQFSIVYRDDCTTVQPPAVTVNYFIKAR